MPNPSHSSKAFMNVNFNVPIGIFGIYAANGGHNIVNTDKINISAGDTPYSLQTILQASLQMIPDTVKINWHIPLNAAGIYTDTNAVNDVTVQDITATSALMQLPTANLYMNTNIDATSDLPINVYGIYGANNSTLNLHSKEDNGTININVGLKDIDAYSTSKYSKDAHTDGVYLDHATLNLFDNVAIKTFTKKDNFDPAILCNPFGKITGFSTVIKFIDKDKKLTLSDDALLQTNLNSNSSFQGKPMLVKNALREYETDPIVDTTQNSDGSKNVSILGFNFNTVTPSPAMITASDSQINWERIVISMSIWLKVQAAALDKSGNITLDCATAFNIYA